MTAAELIKLLNKVPPDTVVHAIDVHVVGGAMTYFPIQYVLETTFADPVTGRFSGDPINPPVVQLMDEDSYKTSEKWRRKHPTPNDVTRVVGHSP